VKTWKANLALIVALLAWLELYRSLAFLSGSSILLLGIDHTSHLGASAKFGPKWPPEFG